MHALLCVCFTQDCYGPGEKWFKSPKIKSSIAWRWHGKQRMEVTWLQAPLCRSSDPCATGGVRHPWDMGGPLLQWPLGQELGGGEPVPWDGSSSHGRGLH